MGKRENMKSVIFLVLSLLPLGSHPLPDIIKIGPRIIHHYLIMAWLDMILLELFQ